MGNGLLPCYLEEIPEGKKGIKMRGKFVNKEKDSFKERWILKKYFKVKAD